MDEKIHFKHDQTTSAEWRTNENPADLWWGPWDFINSRLLLGAGVACVGFMVNYSPIIWHTLTYEKHTVSLGIWSTFIVILFHIYCILNWRVTFMSQGVIGLSPHWNWWQQQQRRQTHRLRPSQLPSFNLPMSKLKAAVMEGSSSIITWPLVKATWELGRDPGLAVSPGRYQEPPSKSLGPLGS